MSYSFRRAFLHFDDDAFARLPFTEEHSGHFHYMMLPRAGGARFSLFRSLFFFLLD